MMKSGLDFDQQIESLHFVFDTGDEDKIASVVQNIDNTVLTKFLETTNSEYREIFIKNYINENILIDTSIDLKEEILDTIGVNGYAHLVAKLDVEDALSVIQEFNHENKREILNLLPNGDTKELLEELLSYPEDSAGRLIHKDFIAIPESWTVDQVVNFLRAHKHIPRNQHQVFVVNKKLKPVGTIELSDILFSKKNTKIEQQMNQDLHLVTTSLDQEEVANIFRQYDLLSTAVVNEQGKMVGIISADDIVDVITKEAEEDILYLGGVSTTDISTKFIKTIFKRLPWLFITFLAINLTSLTVGLFEKTLQKSVELAILMPVIAAMGGNAGVQASTIAVRAIATGRLNNINSWRLLLKELFVGLVNGVILSILTMLIIALRFHNFTIEFVFVISMVVVCAVATVVGALIPIILNRLGADPALSSSIITSAITDMLGFSVLLGIATLLLPF